MNDVPPVSPKAGASAVQSNSPLGVHSNSNIPEPTQGLGMSVATRFHLASAMSILSGALLAAAITIAGLAMTAVLTTPVGWGIAGGCLLGFFISFSMSSSIMPQSTGKSGVETLKGGFVAGLILAPLAPFFIISALHDAFSSKN